MQAGLLRHRVTVQSLSGASDGQGGQTRTPTTLVDHLPASVEALSWRELQAAQGHEAQLTTKVRIRYRTDIKPFQRVIHGSRTLVILSVEDPTGEQAELVLYCAEAQAA